MRGTVFRRVTVSGERQQLKKMAQTFQGAHFGLRMSLRVQTI